MNIAYIRHLESTANFRRGFCYDDEDHRNELRLPSDDDVPLSSRGIEHGERIRLVLQKQKILDLKHTRIIASPYRRTRHTAEILFPEHVNQIIYDARLCERNNGWCAHMTQAEVEQHFPWLKRYWHETNPLLATPPGGESLLDVVCRVMPVIHEAQHSHPGKARTTLIIGHGNLFKAIDFILRGMTFEDFRTIPNAPNGSLTLYRNVHLGHAGMSVDKYHDVLSK